MSDDFITRVRLLEHTADGVVVSIDQTHYRLHLSCDGQMSADVGDRVRGVIGAKVWKVDFVSTGGAYIEPVYGRPRRIQGRVVGSMADGNRVVVEVCGCRITGEVPQRWPVDQLPSSGLVALDVEPGAVFEPVA